MTIRYVAEVVLAGVVIAAAVSDLRRGKVYNWLTYPAIAVGLGLAALEGWQAGETWPTLKNHLLGFGLAFGLMFAVYVMGGMGGGDVKLMGAVGAFVGWPGALYAVFYAFLVGVVIGVALVVRRRRIGLFLRRLGVALRLLPMPGVRTEEAIPETSAPVPFGLAVCLGTLWYLAEATMAGTLWESVTGMW